jgi:hypothetical protein
MMKRSMGRKRSNQCSAINYSIRIRAAKTRLLITLNKEKKQYPFNRIAVGIPAKTEVVWLLVTGL